DLKDLSVGINDGEMVGDDNLLDYVILTKEQGTTVKYVDGEVSGYTITGVDKDPTDNYEVTITRNGIYTITPRLLSVSIGSASSVYGESVLTSAELYALTTVSGYASVDQGTQLFELATTATNISDAGNYAISVVEGSLNPNYSIASINQATTLYTVSPREVHVTIDNQTTVYGESLATLTAQISATTPYQMLDGHNFMAYVLLTKAEGTTVKYDGDGNIVGYAITGADVDENDNYSIVIDSDGIYTITPRQITIEIVAGVSEYGNAINLHNLVNVVGTTLVDSKEDVFGLTLQAVTQVKARRALTSGQTTPVVGTYNIICENINANYQFVTINNTPVVQDVPHVIKNAYKVEKRQITITIIGGQKTYDGLEITDEQLAEVAINWAGLIDDNSTTEIASLRNPLTLSVTGNDKDVIDGGYAVTGTFAHDNYEATIVDGVYTIKKLAVTVQVDNGSKVYDGNGIATLDVDLSVPDAVTADVAELLALAKQKFVAITESDVNTAGYAITFNATEHKNYTISYTQANYVIEQRPITVTLNATSTVYGNAIKTAQELNNLANVVGAVEKDKDGLFVVTTTATDGANAGKYNLEFELLNNNYVLETAVDGTNLYEITKRDVTVTIGSGSKVYDGLAPDLSNIQITVEGYANEQDKALIIGQVKDSLNQIAQADANLTGYAITSNFAGNDNYNKPTYNTGEFIITKKNITFEIGNGTKVYDKTAPTLDDTIAVTINGAVNSTDEAQLVDAVRNAFVPIENVNVGSYDIKSTFTSNTNYNVEGYTPGSFNIPKRDISVAFGSITKTYGDAVAMADELFAQVTVTGAIFDDKQDLFALTADKVTSVSGVGYYNVVASEPNGNYNITFVENFGKNSYQIQAKSITLVVTSTTSTYGNDIENVAVALKDANSLVDQDTLASLNYTVEHEATKGSNVGKYTITSTDKDANYNITFEYANNVNYYEITKRPVTLVIGNTGSRDYNGSTIDVSKLSKANFSWTGLIGEEDLSEYVTFSVVQNGKDVVEGGYTVTVTFAHDNYTATIVDGVYTINKRDISVTIAQISSIPESEVHVTVNATMSWQDKQLDFAKVVYAVKDGETIVARITNGVVDTVLPFGTYTVVIDSYNDTNFNITSSNSQTLEIVVSDNSYVVDIQFDQVTGKHYNNVKVNPTITVTERISGVALDETSYTVVITRDATTVEKINDAGSYVLRVYVDSVQYGSAMFEIEKRPVTLVIGDTGSRDYNGSAIDVSELSKANFSWTGLIGEEDLSEYVTLSVAQNGKDVVEGGYTVTGTFAHDNYTATIVDGVYTINKLAVTV
ncbi:MAG: hypothetical protein IJX23_05365, partial [Clostridia bacterium]|nr:hypothetical protein [Clostridia bacterium]